MSATGVNNDYSSMEHAIAVIKELLPAADRFSPDLRRRALDHVEAYTLILPSGERIPASSGLVASKTPLTNVQLDRFHREEEIALILRNYGTFQFRLNAINFDAKSLSESDKEFYESIIDPITQEVMNDPIRVSSGQLYDRQSLLDCFKRKKHNITTTLLCLLTRLPIHTYEVFDCFSSKKELEDKKRMEQDGALMRAQINDFVIKQAQNNPVINMSSTSVMQANASHVGMFAQHSAQSATTATNPAADASTSDSSSISTSNNDNSKKEGPG